MAKLGARAGWHGNYFEGLTANKSLSPSDSGKVFTLDQDASFDITLPTASKAGAGWNCKFIVKAAPDGAAYVVTEKTSDDTNIIVTNGIVELEVDTGTDGLVNTAHTTITFAAGVAVQGDWIEVLCDGTNFYVKGATRADGGITLA